MIVRKAQPVKTLNTIVSVPIDSVFLWKDNPRKNEKAVPELVKSLTAHGQIKPIIVWVKNRVIYAGNTTWKSMKAKGEKFIDAILVDFPSESAAIAYGIADNKTAENSEWDEKLLLKFLNMKEVPLQHTGFSETEKRFIMMGTDPLKIDRVNAKHSTLKDKIVVMIVDQSSKRDIVDLLNNWIKTTGLKNIEVQK